MAPFLKERLRVPESVEEMVRVAEQYMEAHCGTITGKITKKLPENRVQNIKLIQKLIGRHRAYRRRRLRVSYVTQPDI